MKNEIENTARALTDLNKWALVHHIVESMYAISINTSKAGYVLRMAKQEQQRLLLIYDRSCVKAKTK